MNLFVGRLVNENDGNGDDARVDGGHDGHCCDVCGHDVHVYGYDCGDHVHDDHGSVALYVRYYHVHDVRDYDHGDHVCDRDDDRAHGKLLYHPRV